MHDLVCTHKSAVISASAYGVSLAVDKRIVPLGGCGCQDLVFGNVLGSGSFATVGRPRFAAPWHRWWLDVMKRVDWPRQAKWEWTGRGR